MTHRKYVLPKRYSTIGYYDQKGKYLEAAGGDVVTMSEDHASDIGAELFVEMVPKAPKADKTADAKISAESSEA